MADEPSEAPASQDTPEAPTEDTPQDTTDWKKRYEDHRAAFDRRDQKWSRYDDNPEEFLRDHGYEVEADEDPEEEETYYEDPYEDLKKEVEALKADRAEQVELERAALAEEAEVDYINSQWDSVLDSERDYTEREIQLIGDLSRDRRDERGRPDVKAAHDEIYEHVLNKEKERWVATKKAPSVKAGQQGGEAPDLDDPKDRHDYMARRLAEIDAEQ